MNVILLSGGSGKRLWPLSNDIRSKQFIKIFKGGDGAYESMAQRMYRMLRTVDKEASVTVAAPRTQVSAVHNQLGEDVGISVEPCRRDTFPAIALATAYLADVRGIDPGEVVVVCPVDPFVESDYFEALKELAQQADRGEANLVLMGIEPTYPSEKYGYILPVSRDRILRLPKRILPGGPSGTAACSPTGSGMCWTGPGSFWEAAAMRICTRDMKSFQRSALTMPW